MLLRIKVVKIRWLSENCCLNFVRKKYLWHSQQLSKKIVFSQLYNQLYIKLQLPQTYPKTIASRKPWLEVRNQNLCHGLERNHNTTFLLVKTNWEWSGVDIRRWYMEKRYTNRIKKMYLVHWGPANVGNGKKKVQWL